MGLLLQLLLCASLVVAGLELCRLLMGSLPSLVVKLGLLRNLRLDPRTTLTVSLSAMDVSLWTQLATFLRAPTTEKLLVLGFPSVHLLVVMEPSQDPQPRKVPPFWESLDTTISLKDMRHPLWATTRVWVPRLFFLCKFVHAVELGVGDLSMDVVEKAQDKATTVVSIQHGSISIAAMFHTVVGELSCTVKLAPSRPTQITLPELGAAAAIRPTEISIRVPISQNRESVRAPIPSAYLVVCDLIQVNLDFERLLLSALTPKQRQHDETSMDALDNTDCSAGAKAIQALTLWRLSELSPDDLHFVVHQLEVNLIDNASTRSAESRCSLVLNNVDVSRCGAVDQEVSAKAGLSKNYSVVKRSIVFTLETLLVQLGEANKQVAVNPGPATVKLDALKLEVETALSIGDHSNTFIDEEDHACHEDKQQLLCVRSTLSGGIRSLAVTVTRDIHPWVASCCSHFDRAATSIKEDKSTASSLTEETQQSEEWSIMDFCEIDMEAHFKMVKTEITFVSLDRSCEVLPNGVPNVSLALGEISIYGHPFMSEEHLGIRAKADIQCSRLKASYFNRDNPIKCPFLSLDFARVFICPIGTMMQNEEPAEVEMEAEWVEVKWSPEMLHGIGGMIELGIFTMAPLLHESRHPISKKTYASPDCDGWKAASSLKVPKMRKMADVAQDNVSPGELIAFRCVAKRICVIFGYVYEGQRQVDCVTVDTFAMSSEGNTGRLRISILEARAFQSRRPPSEVLMFAAKSFNKQTPFRRKSFTSRASRSRSAWVGTSAASEKNGLLDESPEYFVSDCFSLEENKVLGSTKSVVDLFVNGVRMEWDIATQLRVMELIRRITFSSWEMIYRVRSAYAIYCTSADSIYNRPYGLNPPLDDESECRRYEKQFADLISASGDKLHRLHATNLTVHAKLSDGIDVHLAVGVFAGDDLPEIWIFESVALQVNGLEMVAVGSVHVRHTIAKLADYVYGEFEDMLRKRLSACKRSTPSLDQNLADGLLIDVNRLQFRTSQDFAFQAHLDAIQSGFEPFERQMTSSMEQNWRPQQELFYLFFLHTPVSAHQKELWVRLQDVEIDLIGNSLESWLERMYPVWIEEMVEQELRAHVLDDHVATLKLTNAELLCDDSYKEMRTLLTEKNAKMYIQKVKRLQALSHETQSGNSGSLLNVSVGQVNVDMVFKEDTTTSWTRIRELDEATEAIENAFKKAGHDSALYRPHYLLFMGIQIKTAITQVTVRMRRFPTPLMSCDGLNVEGDVFVVAYSSSLDKDSGTVSLEFLGAIRCFLDLSVDISRPVLYFSPNYLYVLNELSELALRLLPLAVLEIDKRYKTSTVDIARRLVHGKVTVSVYDAAVRLLCAATSFEFTDYLEIVVHRVHAVCTSGAIDIEVTRVTAKIEPGALSYIAELSHLKLQIWLKWDCLCDPSVHYIYPIEFNGNKNSSAAGEQFVLCFPDHMDGNDSGRALPKPTEQVGDLRSNNQLRVYEATELSVFISGRICPVDSEITDPSNTNGWSKREMAARTAVVLYSKHVEWLIGFGRLYQKVPMYPLPRRKYDRTFTLPPLDLLSVVKGVTVEEFDLIGLDLALYASEKHPVGIRLFINDKISCVGALLRSSHEVFRATGRDCVDKSEAQTDVRRLSFPIEDSTWFVHNVTVIAQDIHARVCTPESGSRGESLVCVKHVSLIVGGGAESVPTHDNGVMKVYSPPPMHYVSNDHHVSVSQSTNDGKERPKTSILEYFDIPNDKPFCYRDSDSDAEGGMNEFDGGESEPNTDQTAIVDEFRQLGFLLGLLTTEVRVTVTLTALESLVDIADTWVQVIVASLPELFHDTAETRILLETEATEEEIFAEDADASPKKFTSLAQDPKFSSLCLQGGNDAPRDESLRFEPTPYSNADTVRPNRRRSSMTVMPSRLSEATEVKHRSTSSKVVQAFLMMKFEDCQISIQDRQHKGSILFALNAGMLRHAVSADSSHERIDLSVDGLQLFTAPLDVDVKSNAIWLKALPDGSYCPSSYGLLKQVIAPIPARVTILVDKDKAWVKNKVNLAIPSIEVEVNPMSKDILENLTTSATALINAKLAEKKIPDHSHILHSYLKEGQDQERSLHQLISLKKQLKWKIAALQWRQLCSWDYRMNERTVVAVSAAESARTLAFDVETSPLFRRRKMSSASVSSATTSISMLGSTATNRYEDDQFTDELQRLTQQFESLLQLTRLLKSEVQMQQTKNNPLPNVDMEFTLDRASLMLSGDNVGIVRAQVGSLCFKMQLFEDHSGNFALALQDLSANNLSPGTPYPDLLLPAYSRTWKGDEMFLRVDAEIAKPVGGVTVVQHFEVNVHPIQVCITQEMIMQLIAFFSPSSNVGGTKEGQREEVRSQFLQARTVSNPGTDGRVGSAILKAVKVAGKAAAHPLSLGRTHRGDSDEELSSSSRKLLGGGLHNIPDDPSQWIAKLTALSESDDMPLFGATDKHLSEAAEREIGEMNDRASNSILFKRIRLGTVEVLLTYKNKKSSTSAGSTHHLHLPHAAQPQALEDMRGFEVKTHALVYCDKTCSPVDLLLRIRRDILLDVLSQVGRNFTNIGNFLRDQFDTSRWATFDALAPLKSLSTTVSSLTTIGPSHIGAVMPFTESVNAEAETTTNSSSLRPTESPRSSLHDWEAPTQDDTSKRHQGSDSSASSTPTFTSNGPHPPPMKTKRSLAKKIFFRRKSSSPLSSPSQQS